MYMRQICHNLPDTIIVKNWILHFTVQCEFFANQGLFIQRLAAWNLFYLCVVQQSSV